MKILRSILLMGCAMMALAVAAQQSDPVIASINEAYRQAKESIKKNKDMGNEMVTKLNRTVRGQGKTYNIGKKKYNEEFLFDSSSQRLLFVITQDYDENGKRFDRRFYFHEGSFYHLMGPPATDFMIDQVFYLADELRHAFDWILQNPKE